MKKKTFCGYVCIKNIWYLSVTYITTAEWQMTTSRNYNQLVRHSNITVFQGHSWLTSSTYEYNFLSINQSINQSTNQSINHHEYIFSYYLYLGFVCMSVCMLVCPDVYLNTGKPETSKSYTFWKNNVLMSYYPLAVFKKYIFLC